MAASQINGWKRPCFLLVCCLFVIRLSAACRFAACFSSMYYHLDGVSAQQLCVLAARRAAKQPQSLHIPFLKNSHWLQQDSLFL